MTSYIKKRKEQITCDDFGKFIVETKLFYFDFLTPSFRQQEVLLIYLNPVIL